MEADSLNVDHLLSRIVPVSLSLMLTTLHLSCSQRSSEAIHAKPFHFSRVSFQILWPLKSWSEITMPLMLLKAPFLWQETKPTTSKIIVPHGQMTGDGFLLAVREHHRPKFCEKRSLRK